ncbi:hypothetical protein AGMMS49974_08630 [Deltaproteobacteria bacterium]|nr:hypothetical protein AGMMS49974_08630 [Deltaproteobacteria bacterium]
MKAKNAGGKFAANVWLTLRVTPEEKNRLAELAAYVGLSISEYIRRRFFGGRPLIARADETAIRELRRLGGLLKHNFETLRQAGGSREQLAAQENLLHLIAQKIDALGAVHDDREED